MEYQVVLEYDPETRHHTATVPGIPGIVADARSERSALKLAREAIAFYLAERDRSRPAGHRGTQKPPLRAKIVTVKF